MSVRSRRGVAVALGAVATSAALVASALAAGVGPAQAAPAAANPVLNVVYDAVGTSHVAKTDSDIALGPTQLTVAVDSVTGDLTGSLPIPQSSTTFKAAGFLPVSAKVDFVEAGPVVGKLGRQTLPGETRSSQFITSTASYFIKLSDVKVGGLPALVGDRCQTNDAVTVPANTPSGQKFNLTTGGLLTGTFSIGRFGHCGLTTEIINVLVPGDGNTVELTVSNGRIG